MRVLFLVIGAALSFVPQEISRWLQSKRDLEKEKRAIKQQRQQQIWQVGFERLSRVETFISRVIVMHLEGDITDETLKPLRDELFYLRTVLRRYPDIDEAFNGYITAARRHTGLKKSTDANQTIDRQMVMEAETARNEAISELFRRFDHHLNRDF